jgi:hypothetical protein
MDKQDIIRMAREAGMTGLDSGGLLENFERFAALVAAAQREACAAMLDANAMACENPIYRSLLQANAQAIREMGQP